jgi:Uma2 family endonuclease
MSFGLSEIDLPIRIQRESPMSDDEFMSFCAANEPLRFERDANGEIIVMSPTGTGGSEVEGDVYLELGNWARADGRGRAYPASAGFKLPDNSVRSADAAWLSFRRRNALSAEQRKVYAHLCPEFVIEVRSETDRLPPLQEKMRIWIANGVELAWLIDPQRKVVEIYRPGEEPEIHEHPTSVQGTGPIAGFELVMGRIWE